MFGIGAGRGGCKAVEHVEDEPLGRPYAEQAEDGRERHARHQRECGWSEELEVVRNLGIDPTNAAPPQPLPQPSNIPPPPPVAGAASGATASARDLEDGVKTANGSCSFTIGAEDPSGAPKRPEAAARR